MKIDTTKTTNGSHTKVEVTAFDGFNVTYKVWTRYNSRPRVLQGTYKVPLAQYTEMINTSYEKAKAPNSFTHTAKPIIEFYGPTFHTKKAKARVIELPQIVDSVPSTE